MRALVVYESMFGNTHVVASKIADGLGGTYPVTLVPVAEATPDLLASADLLVVGGPTHMHGLSTAMTRRMAAHAAAKPDSGLSLDPDATGPGVRDLLKRPGSRQVLAAAFDTRLPGAPKSTGQASRRIARCNTPRKSGALVVAVDQEAHLQLHVSDAVHLPQLIIHAPGGPQVAYINR